MLADRLARTGRSGNRNGLEITYGDVVDGYRRLLVDVIARPVVVICHSMGGAVTWQLVQHESDLWRASSQSRVPTQPTS